MKYSLETKHYNQLIKWAQQNGLDVKHGATKAEEVIRLIEVAYPGIAEIDLAEGDEPAQAAMPVVTDGETGKPSSHYRDDPVVTINIQNNNENGGAHPVPVCVNGDHILIKRNTDVPIPYRFWLALENAVQTEYRQEHNAATGKPDTIIEQRRAYQYSSSGVPSAEVIAAWHERTKDIGRDKREDPGLKTDQAVKAIAGAILEQLKEGAAQAA